MCGQVPAADGFSSLPSTTMRTYSSRARKPQAISKSSSASPEPESPGPSAPAKRPLAESEDDRTKKRVRPSPRTAKSKPAATLKQKSLTQLHFCVDQPIIRRCPLCDLCYTRGAAEDVALHKAHCTRVQKGMEWGKEEDGEGYGTSITEVKSRIKLGNGRTGRIISFPADVGGKIGSKARTTTLLLQHRSSILMLYILAFKLVTNSESLPLRPSTVQVNITHVQSLSLPRSSRWLRKVGEHRRLCHCAANSHGDGRHL